MIREAVLFVKRKPGAIRHTIVKKTAEILNLKERYAIVIEII